MNLELRDKVVFVAGASRGIGCGIARGLLEEGAAAAKPAAWKWIERDVALRRFGAVQELADTVLFIASPRAAFMTGECVVVDGGQVR